MNVSQHDGGMNRTKLTVAAMILVLALAPLAASTIQATVPMNSVTLAWDASEESDVAGYVIYYGESAGRFNQYIDVGNATTVRIDNLIAGLTYSFHATCYNSDGLESGPSNVVYYSVSTTAPSERSPRITCTRIDADAVVISWTSVVDATYLLLYKEKLNDPNWTLLGGPIFATDSVTFYIDPTTNRGAGGRYYSVMRWD
jgi:fibronectin type 3 domain-containing protein